jgi:hypothetical protein
MTMPDVALGMARLQAFVRAERYATTTDNREPRNTVAPYWKRALGTAGAGARLRSVARGPSLYGNAWASVMLFSGAGAELQWRSEIGARATGRAGGLDLFVAYEHTFDDVTRPTPQRSGVFGIGVRFGPQ